jgi:hypothetical protein
LSRLRPLRDRTGCSCIEDPITEIESVMDTGTRVVATKRAHSYQQAAAHGTSEVQQRASLGLRPRAIQPSFETLVNEPPLCSHDQLGYACDAC